MKIVGAKVLLLRLRLKAPFETSHGTYSVKDTILVRATSDDGLVGFGEAPVLQTPSYAEECTDTVIPVLLRHVLPSVLGQDIEDVEQLEGLLAWIRGNSAAKCAVEAAWWYIRSLEAEKPLHALWDGSRERVAAGISLGIDDDERLMEAIDIAVDGGFSRLKIKIKPERDVRIVELIRDRYPSIDLSVDANGAYSLSDVSVLQQLDDFSLFMIEQPLAVDDLIDHAELHRQISTPICLDESVKTRDNARKAIDTGAAQIINVKPSRLGGYGQSIKTAEDCFNRDIPVWCGGMLETGIGKAFNVQLSSLPAFSLPGDISGTDRYFLQDILTQPIIVDRDGYIAVSKEPGIGYDIDQSAIDEMTVDSWTLGSA